MQKSEIRWSSFGAGKAFYWSLLCSSIAVISPSLLAAEGEQTSVASTDTTTASSSAETDLSLADIYDLEPVTVASAFKENQLQSGSAITTMPGFNISSNGSTSI